MPRAASEVVLEKLRFPVSVAMAVYRSSAMSLSISTPNSSISRRAMTPVAAAPPSTRLSTAKRGLVGWWSISAVSSM